MDKWFISISPLTGVPLIPQSELVAHPLQFNPITLAASRNSKREPLCQFTAERKYQSLSQRNCYPPSTYRPKQSASAKRKEKQGDCMPFLLMLSNKTYEVASDLRTQTNQLLSAGRSPIGDLLRVGALAISFGLSSVTFTFTTLN